MIRTNLEKLVEMAVSGTVAHPCAGDSYSGINLTVRVGDPALFWASDGPVEPGVALENRDPDAAAGLALHACIGNEAVVLSAAMEGKEKLQGATGVVTGKTACGRVLVHFPKRVVERLSPGDRIQLRAGGRGLQLGDYPDVRCLNLGPKLLKALNPSEKGGKVRVPVAKVLPGKLLGAFGSGTPGTGDVDIQNGAPESSKESLDTLRLGDLVAVSDYDASEGGQWRAGAVTVGAVIHGAGRRGGPGLNILLTSPKGAIEAIITRKANLAELLALQ
ncbi:MAG TPA: DUF4438 domain-containing protein [Planctomycetota bacterium]|nr:DUF4438 domain-containing protein [Planctomycetota bacterium]